MGNLKVKTKMNNDYKNGTYSLREAEELAANIVRETKYGTTGYFWVDKIDGTNVVLLGSDTEGTNRMESEDAYGKGDFTKSMPTSISKRKDKCKRES